MIRLYIFLVISLITWPVNALADRCSDLATPDQFTADSAMEAIFCTYSREHSASLLPLKYTSSWNTMKADTLASPILVDTYREGESEKGLLVVARQRLEHGEIYNSHGTGAEISVYVFQKSASGWVFEKGKKTVATAGAYGHPPAGRLIRLGDHKFGLLFESTFCQGGYCEGSAFIVALSDVSPDIIGTFDMSGNNDGAEAAQWQYEGHFAALDIGQSDYYVLQINYQGTESSDINNQSTIVPRQSPQCFSFANGNYRPFADSRCITTEPLLQRHIFPASNQLKP